MGGDWEVALILLTLCVILAVVALIICRMLGIWRVTTCFASGEEKASLTKHEQTTRNGYMVTSDSDFKLDTSGKFMDYDTLHSDPSYMHLEEAPSPPPTEVRIETNIDTTSPTESIDDSESIASELDSRNLSRAISCESIASDSSVMQLEPEVSRYGQIEFALEYDREVSELVVSMIQARDLAPTEYTGTLDSYVKIYLQPNGDKLQTKVQKKTCNPVYKERFMFSVEPEHIYRKVIQFHVYSCDKYARHKQIGETEIRLEDIDLRYLIRLWMNLRDIDERPADLGDMMFSLSYLPTAERLTVVVVKARGLKWSKGRTTGDPFVKVYLLQNGKKVSKKRTTVKKDEKSPIFNEAMIFSVPANALPTVQLRLTVAEQLADGKVSSIGHVIVGSQLTGTELSHWTQMMTSLRKPVSMWHPLRK